MKWLIITILILSGCKEQDMASSGKGYPLELVVGSSNVTNYDLFDPLRGLDYGYSAGDRISHHGNDFIVETEEYPFDENKQYINDYSTSLFDISDRRLVLVPWDMENGTRTDVKLGGHRGTFVYVFANKTQIADAPSGAPRYTFDVTTSMYPPHHAGATDGTPVVNTQSITISEDVYAEDFWVENGKLWKGHGYPHKTLLTRTGVSNSRRPLDVNNNTVATMPGLMTMIGKVTHKSNAFTLANVIGTTIDYVVKDSSGTVIKKDSTELDCWLDDEQLYDQTGVTLLIPLGIIIEADSTIEITISNGGESTQLGTFESNTVVNDGITGFDITIKTTNYNSHKPNAWGEIELGAKPVVTLLQYKVRGAVGETLNKAHRRHKMLEEAYCTVDATDIVKKENIYSIKEAVKRGIMTVTNITLVLENGMPSGQAEYTVDFKEIV